MDLQELRCFQHVATLGSLSRAAVQLGISQPSLSRQIQKLEEELGSKLFYRNGRGVTLTLTGERLLAGSIELLADASRLRNEIASHARHPEGNVTFGLPPSLCAAIGHNIAHDFRVSHPNVSLRLYEHFSATLLEWVCSARLDLTVLYDVRKTPGLHVTPLFREHLFLVQPPGAPTPISPLRLADLAGQDFILPGAGNGLRKVIQQAVADAGEMLSVSFEVDSIQVIKQLVETTGGATILPFGAVYREVREGRLQAFEICPDALSAMLVTAAPASQPITVATQALYACLTRQLTTCLEAGILRGVPLSLRPHL